MLALENREGSQFNVDWVNQFDQLKLFLRGILMWLQTVSDNLRFVCE